MKASTFTIFGFILLNCLTLVKLTAQDKNALLADSLIGQAKLDFESGRYAGQEEKCFEALRLYVLTEDLDSLKLATALNWLGLAKGRLGQQDTAIIIHKNALGIRIRHLGEDNADVAFSLNHLGNCYFNKSAFEHALEYHQRSLAIRQKIYDGKHYQIADSYQNLGNLYKNWGHIPLALEYAKKALEMRKSVEPDSKHLLANYRNLGIIYFELSDYARAIEHYQIAKKGWENDPFTPKEELAKIWESIGFTYYTLEQYERADYYYTEGQRFWHEALPENNPRVAYARVFYAYNLLELGQSEKARQIFERCDSILTKVYKPGNPFAAQAQHGLGLYHLYHNQPEIAASYFEAAKAVWEKMAGETHPTVVETYNQLAKCSAMNGDFERADSLMQKALRLQGVKIASELATIIPQTPRVYLETLVIRAWIAEQRSLREHSPDWLRNSLEADLTVVDFLEHIQRQGFDVQSKILLNSSYYNVYEKIISKQLTLAESDLKSKAFEMSENAKSNLLLEAVKEANAKSYEAMPDSLLVRESELRNNIAFYQVQLNNATFYPGENEAVVQAKLADSKREFQELKTSFEKENQKYFQLKYGEKFITVDKAQHLLSPHQTLLEYFVGDSSIFLFVIKKDLNHVEEIKNDFPLKAWVDSLRARMFRVSEKANSYSDVAASLYDKLLRPVEQYLTDTSLIIIPDGALGYLPFDALLTHRPTKTDDYRGLPYLVRKHAISYCYSATLLRLMKEKTHRHPPSEGLLAFAPWTIGSSDGVSMRRGNDRNHPDSLSALEFSRTETESVAKMLDSKAFYDDEATKAKFLQLAKAYRILFLSMHGRADSKVGDNSWLAFFNGKNGLDSILLYVRELYNIELNADMVFLSACETNIGEIQRGEGIISLARAFAYAGAKSIVSTLWQVLDEATADVSQQYFAHLKTGKLEKDKALQRAKLDYIAKHPNVSPYHWAGLIPIGDTSAIW